MVHVPLFFLSGKERQMYSLTCFSAPWTIERRLKMSSPADDFIPCHVARLPESLQWEAHTVAIAENPANAPLRQHVSGSIVERVFDMLDPGALTALTQKYWRSGGVDLSVSFGDNPSTALRRRMLEFANHWGTKTGANVRFRETSSNGQVRILRSRGGYWSYLGTDILSVPTSQQTMNLEGYSDSTPDSEFERSLVHEFGHTMGFPHEHLRAEIIARIDRNKALRYFEQTQGWSERTTISNVLTPLQSSQIIGTPEAEEDSIMCYQLPGTITIDGRPIRGGARISEKDAAFVRKTYPSLAPPPPPVEPPVGDDFCEVLLRFKKGKKLPDFEVIVKRPDDLYDR